jgi:hypothetical protein
MQETNYWNTPAVNRKDALFAERARSAVVHKVGRPFVQEAVHQLTDSALMSEPLTESQLPSIRIARAEVGKVDSIDSHWAIVIGANSIRFAISVLSA